MEELINKLKNISRYSWILILIVLLGIFLRTYNFRNWLTFNPDQARDAILVNRVIEGETSWPLLGPEAGNTHFDLGPWFYHLEIISAKIFGNTPDKLAYPDLFFSILTIILFYWLVKKYFSQKISLLITFFVSISYFMIRYSRFAFNPNSIPFFVLLFFLGGLYLMDLEKKEKIWGSVLIGTSIGVGMQLHILLFFILPVLTGGILLYLAMKKVSLVTLIKQVAIILLLVLIFNTGQIISEFQHHGSNNRRFFKAFEGSTQQSNLAKSLGMTLLGQAEGNLHIITSLGTGEKSSYYKTSRKFWKKKKLFVKNSKNYVLFLAFLGSLYSILGYYLLFYYWRKEKDCNKKNFLTLIGAYAIVALLVMFPIISQASLRYYIVIFFLPFIFLGLTIKYLIERKRLKKGFILTGILILSLASLQFVTIIKKYNAYQQKYSSNSRIVTLDEVKEMMKYIQKNTDKENKVYISGQPRYFSRYYKPLLYLSQSTRVKILRGEKEKKIKPGIPIFYIRSFATREELKTTSPLGRKVVNSQSSGNITIIQLKN